MPPQSRHKERPKTPTQRTLTLTANKTEVQIASVPFSTGSSTHGTHKNGSGTL